MSADISGNENRNYSFTADSGMQGLRLDVAITEYCRRFSIEMSRSSLKSGNTPLHVNGKAEKLGYRVRTGDLVDFMMVKPKELRAFPQKVDFEIVYRDEDIAVINKPYGLTVHPAKGHEEGTLVHGLLYYLGSSLPDMSGPDRPGIVHRLDKDTAGLMIVALNEKAHRRLTDDFRNRKISKTYHAVVKGTLKGSGIIDEPIGRSCSDRKKMAVRTGGRPAVTRYRVLENLESHSYVEIEILTGRTHQIRVHFSYIGHPVEGDRLYSKSYGRFGLTGLALCSKKISFIHPVKGAMMDFEIDLPEEMKNLLLKLRMK